MNTSRLVIPFEGDIEKISYGTVFYALMDGIDTSEKLVEAKNN